MIDVQKACTQCGGIISSKEDQRRHPVLNVLQCAVCHVSYKSVGDLTRYRAGVDVQGHDNYCRWCLDGGELILCADENCRNGFCRNCINRNLGRKVHDKIEATPSWFCFVCDYTQLDPLGREKKEVTFGGVEPSPTTPAPTPKLTEQAPKSTEKPAKPAEPTRLSAPTEPAEPAKIVESVGSVEPTRISEPNRPAEPVKIAESIRPVEPTRLPVPDRPAEPVKIAESVRSAEPRRLSVPIRAAEPVKILKSVGPAEPTRFSMPIRTAEPVKIAESVRSAEPRRLSVPIRPDEPTHIVKSVGSAEPTRLSVPIRTVEPVSIAESVKSAEPARLSVTIGPVEPIKTIESIRSAEQARPSMPVESAEPVGSSKPNRQAEPIKSLVPVDSAKSVRLVEPVKSIEPMKELPKIVNLTRKLTDGSGPSVKRRPLNLGIFSTSRLCQMPRQEPKPIDEEAYKQLEEDLNLSDSDDEYKDAVNGTHDLKVVDNSPTRPTPPPATPCSAQQAVVIETTEVSAGQTKEAPTSGQANESLQRPASNDADVLDMDIVEALDSHTSQLEEVEVLEPAKAVPSKPLSQPMVWCLRDSSALHERLKVHVEGLSATLAAYDEARFKENPANLFSWAKSLESFLDHAEHISARCSHLYNYMSYLQKPQD